MGGLRGRVVAVCVAVATAMTAAPVAAQINGPTLPANDFESALALTGGQRVASGPATVAPHPALTPVPRASCGAGSSPLNGDVQGRVPRAALGDPQAAKGWTCNVSRVGRHTVPGGFRVWRFVDRNKHVCAFYDSSLGSPANLVSLAAAPTQGVVVLDMADPARPVQTDLLLTPGMLSPHESLNLNAARGLLGAETGTALTSIGTFDLYDVSDDCRHPVLQSVTPSTYGHESGFSPDGKTFWTAGGTGTITAYDVTNPKLPVSVWVGNLYSHGLNFSADGRTMYQTDPINGNLGVLDVSDVQGRKPSPQVHQRSRITWDTVSIPQNTIPVTFKGHPYLIEFDEFAFRFNPLTVDDKAGAARIIDISDPARPVIVSDLRLEVNMRAAHAAAGSDPYGLPVKPLGYGAHYCAVPTQQDPSIVACSFLNSGLRIFDIRDPLHPRESGYFVSPPAAGAAPGQEGDLAFSQPAFDVARKDVWYTDAGSGLYVLHLDDAAWPAARVPCIPRRRVTIRLPRALRTASVRYAGRRAVVRRRAGRLTAVIDLHGLSARTVRVDVRGTTRGGRTLRQTRRLKACRSGAAR